MSATTAASPLPASQPPTTTATVEAYRELAAAVGEGFVDASAHR